MTDNEISQALLCHEQWGIDACDSCPLTPGKACGMQLAREALELINRQKSEIERLKETPKCVYAYDGETMEYCVEGPCSAEKTIEAIRAEAIKEFAERLKECCGNNTDAPIIWVKGAIDNLVKEMTEEPK